MGLYVPLLEFNLLGAVTKFGHPFRAASVFAALMVGIDFIGGTPPSLVLGRGIVSLLIASAVFWLVDRTQSILLGLIVTIAGAGALIFLT